MEINRMYSSIILRNIIFIRWKELHLVHFHYTVCHATILKLFIFCCGTLCCLQFFAITHNASRNTFCSCLHLYLYTYVYFIHMYIHVYTHIYTHIFLGYISQMELLGFIIGTFLALLDNTKFCSY